MWLVRRHRISDVALLMATLLLSAGNLRAEAPHNYRDANFDYFVSGDPTLPRAAHTEFLLALMGGGGSVDAAFTAIAAHAGHGHIVILRAVSDDSYDPEDGDYGVSFATKWGGVTSAETIVFHRREASFDPRVIAALRNADGVFLAGGDQSNYIRYWKNTPVQELLNAHVQANRPMGGSSAGLAILGHYSYTAFDGGSMESKVAFADPYGSGITLEDDFLHLRWLENVITDTHFSARSRLGRLIVFLARLNQDQSGTKIVGIGLDEKSALLIGADGVGRLADGSAASAWLVELNDLQKLPKGQPLTLKNIHIVQLNRNSSIDMKSREVASPAATTRDSIVHGIPSKDPLTHAMMTRNSVPPDES